MSPQNINRVFSVFFFVLGIFIWFAIPYQIKKPRITTMRPRFFPRIISLILMITSVVLVLETFLKSKKI